jgi:hypothetical protein
MFEGGCFFFSIKSRASPTLVFPCTYPSVNTAHLFVSEQPQIVLLVFKKPSSINQSLTIVNQSLTIVNQSLVIVNQSLAIVNQSLVVRSLVKNKKLSVFFSLFLFCFFVNIRVFGHSELRVCFSFLSSNHMLSI